MEYLFKSILCLLVLLLIHRVLLQQEVLHRFNRFYLLIAVVSSFLIPFLTIELPTTELNIPQDIQINSLLEPDFIASPQVIGESISIESTTSWDWASIMWMAYSMVTFILFIRFIRNIHVLRSKIKRNIQVNYRGQLLIILEEESLPFSFLKYIFISKSDFDSGKFTEAVFEHERTHVIENHSWDLIFIEALLVSFWFHPGLYLAKHAVKINHEFIADQVALQKIPISEYQKLLLSFATRGEDLPFASSLNFSLTKKRLEMMKRKTKPTVKWLKLVFLIPLGAGIVYLFSNKVVAQRDLAVQETGQPFRNAQIQQANPISYLSIADLVNKSDAFPRYVQMKNEYVSKLDGGVHFIQKSGPEQEQLLALFTDLSGLYFRLSEPEKRQAGRPKHPFAPFSRFEIDGKIVYKVWEDLSESEREQLPSRPPIKMKSQELAAYVLELNKYELNRNAGEHFIKKSGWNQELSMDYYQKIQKHYALLPLAEKQHAIAPTHPYSPYVRIVKKGMTIFKLAKDLTEEEMKLLGCNREITLRS